MAEIRAASTVPNLPAAPRGSARADAVRSAQAAFFQAALADTGVPRPAAAAAIAVQPVAAPSAARAFDADAPAPTRLLPPGSLVDLKV